MIWVGVMLLLFSSSPNENRFIGFAEKSYINQKIKIENKKNLVSVTFVLYFKIFLIAFSFT